MKAADVLTAEGKKYVSSLCQALTVSTNKMQRTVKVRVTCSRNQTCCTEAGIADFWYKYVGFEGRVVGMNSFGESAPADQLFKLFGFTVDNVVAKSKRDFIIIEIDKGRQ